MSKALKVIGTIAGAVALVAGTIATAGIGTAAFAATMGTIATASGLAAGFATLGAQALYKPPPARGSVTNVLIAVDPPSPYVMGEGYFAGVLRHDAGYGATLKKVPNPYRLMVTVYSHGGPVQSISPRVELGVIGSYYNGFLYAATQLGACPEASALTPQFAGAPGWGAASKLSGQAAIAWNLKFDKDGKVFASGVPRLGAYGQWVKAYDPRKDSTFPGGSGAHRLGVETTYEWTQNPALHAGTYAYGRYQNGKRVMGIGMPATGIDWVGVAGWANVCDANGWTIFGPVYEPGNRWENLREICAAGGCTPVFASGLIGWHYAAPRVALDTITDADIADENYSVTAMASWRERLNTIVPKYISPDHEWQLIADSEAVTIAEYVTEDGEEKKVEWPFNLVKNGDQAAQLAAYKMLDSRELQPIVLPCLPRLRKYRPGECLHIDLPELGLDTDAVILTRSFDPARMVVTLTLMGETPGKHDFALGRTATPPPTPALKQTAEERDNLRWAAQLDQGARTAEYDAAATYSEGMTVRMPDGSTWEYINTSASSGNAPPTWPDVSNAWWNILSPPLNRGKIFVQPNAPTAEESTGGDTWQDSDGRYWQRREDNHLSIGGNRLMIGGSLLTMTWTPNPSQPVRDGIDEALATALAATEAAAALAQDAQATADGKVQSFYQSATPTAEGVGDLWFKSDTGKWYRAAVAGANSIGPGAWVLSEDSGIGQALSDAAGAQATADGKVTTFISESAPTAEAVGDLWFRASTGELRRWSGSSWGDPLVDLTAAAQVVVVPPAAIKIYRTSTGEVKAGQLPIDLVPSVTRGGVNYRTNDAVDYSVTGTGGLSGKVSVNNTDGSGAKGTITIADTVTSAGSIQLSVSVSGIAVGAYVTQVSTEDDAPPVNNGTAGGTDSSLEAVSSTSYAAMSGQDGGDPVMDVQITSGQTLKLNANFYYLNNSTGGLTMTCKGQYHDGANWQDMNSGAYTEKTGTEAQKLVDPVEYVEGAMVAEFTKTGLASGTYPVRLMGKLTSGSGTLTPTSGGATSSRS